MSPERQDCSQQQIMAVKDDENEGSEAGLAANESIATETEKLMNCSAYHSVPLTADVESGDLS